MNKTSNNLKNDQQDQHIQAQNMHDKNQPILSVRELTTQFSTPDGSVCAVNKVSFDLYRGESLGVVGESGSGKTQVFMSLMSLLANNGYSTGSAKLEGQELIGMPRAQLDKIRGNQMAMIFQDPMTSLNPFLKVSKQMTEVLSTHKHLSLREARIKSLAMLDLVGIPDAKNRFDLYPHEFSGGMRQRVMIAMSLLCEPRFLIADEPTTALDVTIQAQILDILANIKRELNTAIVMITHDLGVVAGLCEKVMVMYGGRIIEKGSVDDIFYTPQHPYTEGLLRSMPRLTDADDHILHIIPGHPPNLQDLPKGCAFAPRCQYVTEHCLNNQPVLENSVACFAPITYGASLL